MLWRTETIIWASKLKNTVSVVIISTWIIYFPEFLYFLENDFFLYFHSNTYASFYELIINYLKGDLSMGNISNLENLRFLSWSCQTFKNNFWTRTLRIQYSQFAIKMFRSGSTESQSFYWSALSFKLSDLCHDLGPTA